MCRLYTKVEVSKEFNVEPLLLKWLLLFFDWPPSAKLSSAPTIHFTCIILNHTAVVRRSMCLFVGECVSYNDLNNLPWLFEGKNGLQHQTYLHMRNLTQ